MLQEEINFFGNGENLDDVVLNRPLENIRENLLAVFTALETQNYDLNQSGFEKRPNGLVYRWGEVTISGDGFVSFDTPFDNDCFITSVGTILAPTTGIPYIVIESHTATGFTVRPYSNIATQEQNQVTFKYIAIGY